MARYQGREGDTHVDFLQKQDAPWLESTNDFGKEVNIGVVEERCRRAPKSTMDPDVDEAISPRRDSKVAIR